VRDEGGHGLAHVAHLVAGQGRPLGDLVFREIDRVGPHRLEGPQIVGGDNIDDPRVRPQRCGIHRSDPRVGVR
jgi:hypothetical protein